MKRVFHTVFGASLVFGVVLTTFAAGVRDAATATKVLQSTITFPKADFYYSAAVWAAGCGDSAGNICGTARESDASIVNVQVSVKREADDGAGYWDGFGFNSTIESFITADGTTRWNLNFPFDRFLPGVYTVHSQVTDDVGQIHSGSLRTFSVSPEYTVIPIISSMAVLGSGNHPALQKAPLRVDLNVGVWEGPAGKTKWIPSTSRLLNDDESSLPSAISDCPGSEGDDCAVKIRYGNSDANLYEILVPSNTKANRAAFGVRGDYQVIGRSTLCLNGSRSYDAAASKDECASSGGTLTAVETSANIYSVQSGMIIAEKHLNVAVDGNGKVHSMRSRQIEGTPLVISVPAHANFAEAAELLPILYESFDGNWKATIHINLPNGIEANASPLELNGDDKDTAVAQITVQGVGANSSIVGLIHSITYREQTIDLRMFLESNGHF